MTKSRERVNNAINMLERAYSVLFYLSDAGLYHCRQETDKTQQLKMVAVGTNVEWGPPVTYQEAVDIAPLLFSILVVNTYIALKIIMNAWLKAMCTRITPGELYDDSWFSFNELDLLSNGVAVHTLYGYVEMAKLFEFVRGFDAGTMPIAGVTHGTVLDTLKAARAFAEDFEKAFLAANAKLKESDL